MWVTRNNTAPVAGARFIEPRILARIGKLELVAKTVVHGFISGLHRAPYLGLSIDFAEHRPYMPGDDIRRIDWRVYGRTDRLFVKEFQAETNANLTLLMDISRSMDYGRGSVSKLEYSRFLAASLGYLSLLQRDRVGLVTFDRDIVTVVPPSVKHFDRVLHALEIAEPRQEGDFEGPLREVGRIIRRRGIVALLSDLYIEPTDLLNALVELRHRGHDVMVFHVLDPGELHLPEAGVPQFEDMETGTRLPVAHDEVRDPYDEALREHIESLRLRLGEQGVDYGLFDTATPLDHALFEYLSDRQRRMRVR